MVLLTSGRLKIPDNLLYPTEPVALCLVVAYPKPLNRVAAVRKDSPTGKFYQQGSGSPAIMVQMPNIRALGRKY